MINESMDLTGLRIVVVEDDHILASALCKELRTFGAMVLGPAPTPFYAMQLIGLTVPRPVDAAVLDIRLHGVDVFPLAERLQDRGIPFVFVTGHDPELIPNRFHNSPVLSKPVEPLTLISALTDIVSNARERPRPSPLPLLPAKPADEPPAVHFARALSKAIGGTQQAASVQRKQVDQIASVSDAESRPETIG